MKSQVMRKAWELFRKAGVRTMEAWGNALRQAWAIVKGVVKVMSLDLRRRVDLYETGEQPKVVTETHTSWSKGWVARVRLAKPGAKFDLDRNFLQADRMDLSRAGNGDKVYFLSNLEDGVYEADSVYRSMQSFRSYFRVLNHSVVQVFESKNDAKSYLAKLS